MAELSVGIPEQTAIDAEFESFYQLAQQPNYIYSSVIMNTTLTMLLFFIMFDNLLLPGSIPYSGYQLTYNGSNDIKETDLDKKVNDEVNTSILAHIKSGKTRFAISLFLHNPVNSADNHANILLFEYGAKSKINSKKILTMFHYEPYGKFWERNFQDVSDKEKLLIDNIIKRINKTIPVKINHQLTTKIDQLKINPIQGLTESGYCQIIALLQAYLFLKYGNKVEFTPDGQTPLGSVIGATSPSASGGRLPEFQLGVIRGFVIYIGQLINQIFAPIGIDVSISTLSHIQHIYNETPGASPIYLIYISALVKYVAEQIRTGGIVPPEIITEISGFLSNSSGIVNQTILTNLEDRAMTLLRRLPNWEFGLLDNEQRRIIKAYNSPANRGGKRGKTKTKKNKKKQRKTKKRRERQRK